MKKITLLLTLLLATVTGAQAVNPHEDPAYKHLGYLPAGYLDLWPYDGIKSNIDVRSGFAVRVGADRLGALKGAKIEKLVVGWSAPSYSSQTEAFIRTSLKGENLATATGEISYTNANGGWNVLTFDKPIEITEDMTELYFGYYADLQKDVFSIPFMTWGNTYPNSQYVTRLDIKDRDGSELWDDYSDQRPLYIEALVVDDPSVKRTAILSLNDFATMPIQILDEAGNADLWVDNIGHGDVNSLTLSYELADVKKDFGELQLSSPITSGTTFKRLILPAFALGSGKHTMKITALNGETLEKPLTKDYVMIGVPRETANKYYHHGVIEYYCSENDHLSAVYYDNIFLPGYQGHYEGFFTVVAQHMNDQFMTGYSDVTKTDDATMILLDYAGGDPMGVSVPVWMVNRTWYTGSTDRSVPTSPVSWLLYPDFVPEVYDPAIESPTFASVKAAADFEGTDALKIEVNGDIAPGILPEGEDLYLTLYVLEDRVGSYNQEFPDDPEFKAKYPDGYYIHDNVIRCLATNKYGDKVTTDDKGNYTRTFNVELDEEWNKDNLRVVAMLSRNPNNGVFNRNIINAAEVKVAPVGINEMNASREEFAIVNGRVVAGSGQDVKVYDLAGRETANQGLSQGIYVVKCGKTSSKIVVK